MTGLPASCPRCGHVFESKAFSIQNGRKISFKGVSVVCPRCGGTAKAIEGTFDFIENAIRVRDAPKASVDIIGLLQLTLKEARAGNTTESIIARLHDADPVFAEQASKIVQKGGLPALTLMLIFLLNTCAANPSTSLDWNRLVDQVYVYITGNQNYQFPEHTSEQTSKSQQPQEQNRQQRRQQERQTKKQERQPGPQSKRTPT